MEHPISDHGSKGLKGDLGGILYPIITRKLANARPVDCRDRRKYVQIYCASKATRAWPRRLFPLLSFPLGFTHRISP
jgi:hypothetical protein